MTPKKQPTDQKPKIEALDPPDPVKLAEARAEDAEARLSTAERLLAEATKALADIEKNPLMVALNYLEGGETAREAGRKLAILTEAVIRLGSKGTLKLEIGVKSFKAGSVTLTGSVKTKVPMPDPEPSIFYLAPGGALSRKDPNQGEFGFSHADRSDPADAQPYGDE